MADLVNIARDQVDAFNNDDWARSEAPLTPATLYNEVGTQRRLHGPAEIIPALKAWKQAMPERNGSRTITFTLRE